MSTNVSLYNPRDTDPEQLAKLLTGRSTLLEEVLEDLRGQAGGSTRQHWLLRGQRGMGKTHLTGVIHYRVRTDPSLQKVYLPLWLGEADVYEVYSAATLLVKVGERLAEETQDEGVLQRMRALEGVGDEEEFFEAMLELLSAEAERRERVLLVLMENLDALLDSFAPKERVAQTRQLRSVLLHNPRFLFISTTPTRYLRSLREPKEPLYGHLKERDLSQLTEQEVGELFQKLVEQTERKDVEDVLRGEEGPLRLRIIHQLTGGLPRSVIMAFTVMQGGAGLGPLVEGLRRFLDAQTAYFEARLARLAPRERAIVTTMALAQENLTLKEIAQRSRLPERTLSTHIQRLENDGHVRSLSGSGGKGNLYELSEGLFRLWYQFRRGQMVLEPLVAFIATWFRAEEIETLVQQQRRRIEDVPPAQRRAAELALLQVETAFQRANSDEGKRQREWLWESARRAMGPVASAPDELLKAFEQNALALFEKGDPVQAMHGFLSLWESQGGGRKLWLIRALVRVWRDSFNRAEGGGAPERELKIYRSIIERFGQEPDAAVQHVLELVRFSEARTLGLLGRYDEGLVKADAIIEHHRDRGGLNSELFGLALFLRCWFLDALGRTDEALDGLVNLLGSAPVKDEHTEGTLAIDTWSRFISAKAMRFVEDEKQWPRYRDVLRSYVERFSSLDGALYRQGVAHAALVLVAGAFVYPRAPRERIAVADEWMRLYGSGDVVVPPETKGALSLNRAREFLMIGDFGRASGDVEVFVECVGNVGEESKRKELVELLLNVLPHFVAGVGPVRALDWLGAIDQPWLDEDTRQQVGFHQSVARLLLSGREGRGASKKVRQEQMELLRVPPELRKTLEAGIRQVYRRKKELGAEW